MKVHDGIACNCSEAVIRLKRSDYERFKKEHLDEYQAMIKKALEEDPDTVSLWDLFSTGLDKPMDDYSAMRPTSEDEVCLYFPQSSGRRTIEKLEEFKIPHDTQQWTVGWEKWRDDYFKINEDGSIPRVKDIEGVHAEEDEHWSYWRRKPYQ